MQNLNSHAQAAAIEFKNCPFKNRRAGKKNRPVSISVSGKDGKKYRVHGDAIHLAGPMCRIRKSAGRKSQLWGHGSTDQNAGATRRPSKVKRGGNGDRSCVWW